MSKKNASILIVVGTTAIEAFNNLVGETPDQAFAALDEKLRAELMQLIQQGARVRILCEPDKNTKSIDIESVRKALNSAGIQLEIRPHHILDCFGDEARMWGMFRFCSHMAIIGSNRECRMTLISTESLVPA